MPNSTSIVSDPFTYLKEDHKKVAHLLEKLTDTSRDMAADTRDDLFIELQSLVTQHAELEEQVLYPVTQELEQTHELSLEALEEHAIVTTLLAELASMEQDTEEWMAKLKVLKDSIEHHVQEEEGEMFKKAKAEMSKEQIDKLTQDMTDFLAEA